MLLNNLGFNIPHFWDLAQNNLMLYIGQIILSKKKVSEEFFGKLVFMFHVHARLLNNIGFPLSIILFEKQIFLK